MMFIRQRFFEIDFIKGFATIFMIIFHFFYLMYFMDIVKFEIKQGILHMMAKISHTIFILMVGINSAISYNKFREKNKKLYEKDKTSFNNQYIGKGQTVAFSFIGWIYYDRIKLSWIRKFIC